MLGSLKLGFCIELRCNKIFWKVCDLKRNVFVLKKFYKYLIRICCYKYKIYVLNVINFIENNI